MRAVLTSLLVLVTLAGFAWPRVSTASAQGIDTMPAIEPASIWAKTKKETSIWSGWDDKALDFGKIPPEVNVQVVEIRGPRSFVNFPGDNRGHKPGQVWIDKTDLQDLPWPRWARARRPTVLRGSPDLGGEELLPLARGNYVETVGEIQGRWAKAFFLTDRQPGEWVMGWVDGFDLMLPTRGDQTEMSNYVITRAMLLTSTPDVWLKVPYRSQLDGSPYAEANCGPTSIAMALAAVGKTDTLDSLRTSALQLQGLGRCDDCGTFIGHLAKVAEMRGASTYGLQDAPDALHHWTTDDVRQQLRQGRVVIPQVRFNLLPGRLKSPYGGDHYIVIVGVAGSSFIYNDPVDSDGRGYGRLITAEQLDAAMSGAHGEFSQAAFAVGKGPALASSGQ
ncbi:MAG: C39 family peptidase [Chloroflexota bacterium]